MGHEEGIGLDARELQSRVVRGVGWSSVATVAGLPLAIVVSAVLARSLGVEEFARFALLSFLVPLLVSSATDFGFEQSATRAGSRAFAGGDIAATRALLGKALGWNLLRLPVAVALALAVARPGPAAALVLVAGLALLHAGSGLHVSLSVENRGAVQAKLAFLAMLAASATSITAALAGASAATVWTLAFVSPVAVIPARALAANRALLRAALTPRLPRALPDGFWRYGMTAVAVSVGSLLVFTRSEVILLEWLGEHHALAVFALAAGLSQRLTTPVDTLLGPLVPALAALDAAHPERLQAGFERALRLSSAAIAGLAGATVVGVAFAAPVLYGPEYHGVGIAFAVLALASLLRSAAQPYAAVLYASGRPQAILGALGVALAVDVAIAVALIPRFGLWGAVAAKVAAVACATVLTARAAAATGGVRSAGVPVARLLALAVGACTAALAAALALRGFHPAAAAAGALAAGPAAVLVLARVSGGLLTRSDAEVLLDALPRSVRRSRAALALVRASA